MSAAILGCHRWEVPLPFSKLRPRMLLDILLCIGQPPPQRIIWTKMTTVLQWRNPGLMFQFQIRPGLRQDVVTSPQAHVTHCHSQGLHSTWPVVGSCGHGVLFLRDHFFKENSHWGVCVRTYGLYVFVTVSIYSFYSLHFHIIFVPIST